MVLADAGPVDKVESRGRGSWRDQWGAVCSGVILNCCFQFLVTDWLCHLDPIVPQFLVSPGPSPLGNALGNVGLWAQWREPGVQKKCVMSPFLNQHSNLSLTRGRTQTGPNHHLWICDTIPNIYSHAGGLVALDLL